MSYENDIINYECDLESYNYEEFEAPEKEAIEKEKQEERPKNVFSSEHFLNWDYITDHDCYDKINYILYNKTHLATQELSKVFMNKYRKTILAMQELKTIRRIYEISEIPYGWKIKKTETIFKKNKEIQETIQDIYFSTRTVQTFSKEEWDNEISIYKTEEQLISLFGENFDKSYSSNQNLCIYSYKKLKEAKNLIELLEKKLTKDNKENYDLEELIKTKENDSNDIIQITFE